jgi:hypothetical protein
MSGSKPTDLLGAVRPQTPHRSPRQAFGGTSNLACLRQAQEKPTRLSFFSLHDYMPEICGLVFREESADLLACSAFKGALRQFLALCE